MAVKRKATKSIDDVLDMGAPTKNDIAQEVKEYVPGEIIWRTMCLRIPSPLDSMIDECLKNRFSITKSAWILEAIREKGQKDLA